MARRAFSAAAPAFFAAVAAAAASAACFSTSAASRSAARRASPARNHSTVHFFRRLTGGPGAAGFATCYWYRSVARIARPAAAAAESSPAAWAAGVVGSGWHCSRARSRFTTSSVPSEKLVSSHASARGSGSAAIISVASPCAAVRHLCAPLLPTPGLLFPLRGELLQLWRLTKVGVLLAARGSGVRVQCKGLHAERLRALVKLSAKSRDCACPASANTGRTPSCLCLPRAGPWRGSGASSSLGRARLRQS